MSVTALSFKNNYNLRIFQRTWHVVPRLFPGLLGLAAGAGLAWGTNAALPLSLLLPVTGWLAGAYYEKSRVFANHLKELAQANAAVRQASNGESHAHAGRAIAEEKSETDSQARLHVEEQLRQSQKLEGIGKLAGGVAHDFNNILSVILGYTTLLLLEAEPGGSAHDGLVEIHKAGERATLLTKQLLAFSRQQTLDPKVADLNEVIADMDSMLRRLIGEDIDFTVRHGAHLGLVKVDVGQMGQVLMNLAVNARDAMPAGGHLTVETQNLELDEAYCREHVDVKAGPYVMLAVTDSGTGMDKATQARIFEPFFSTKAKDKGTGLGLSTVFGIVRQSGGHILLYSEPGQGSSFKVYLPRVTETKAAAPAAPAAIPARGGHECVLLVEDEPQLRALTRQVLLEWGYKVLDAPGGEQALAISRAHAGPIDLLLTDVVMPQMSGRQLADRLLPQRPGMKVLYVSGYTDNAIVHHGILERGIAFLQKPFAMQALGHKLREVLDKV
jgi:two-component system cell cycle sensor histidine kinase/response regulator CckA